MYAHVGGSAGVAARGTGILISGDCARARRAALRDDGAPLPLYLVDGESNVADLLTKEHALTWKDVSEGSLWQTGPDWLSRPVDLMPLRRYTDIFMKSEEEAEALKECHAEPFMLTGEVEGRRDSKQITLFKSVGLAVQDLFATICVFDNARRLGLGQELRR